jgi:hypothetical protein
LRIAGVEAVDEINPFPGGRDKLEDELDGFIHLFAMDDLAQATAAGSDGLVKADGGFGEELEGIEAIGFAGVIAAHQEREVVEMIQLHALDAFVVAGDHPLETEVNKFHHAGVYIVVFAQVSRVFVSIRLMLVHNCNRNPNSTT